MVATLIIAVSWTGCAGKDPVPEWCHTACPSDTTPKLAASGGCECHRTIVLEQTPAEKQAWCEAQCPTEAAALFGDGTCFCHQVTFGVEDNGPTTLSIDARPRGVDDNVSTTLSIEARPH